MVHAKPGPRYGRDVWLLIAGSATGSGAFLGMAQLITTLFVLRLGYGPQVVGALVAAGSVAYSLASLLGGALAARLGVGRMMAVGILLNVTGLALLPLALLAPAAARLPLLVAGQLISNGGWSMKQVSLIASMAGVTTPGDRGGAYALHEAACGGGMLAGALLGGALPGAIAGMLGTTTALAGPYAWTLGISAVGSALALVPVLRVSPAPAPTAAERKTQAPLRFALPLVLLIACGIATTAGQSVAKTFASAYLDTTFRAPTALIGTIISAGLGVSVLAALAGVRLARRFSSGQIMLGGSALIAAGLALLALSPSLGGALAGIVAVYGVLGLWRPAYQAAQMEIARPEERAAVSGMSAMGMSVGYGGMAYGGGYLVAGAGYPAAFGISAGIALASVAFSALLSRRMAGGNASSDRGAPGAQNVAAQDTVAPRTVVAS